MLFIEDDKVYLTRGDDAVLQVALNGESEPYVMQTGDVLSLTVRELPTADSPVLFAIKSLTERIVIRHEDTKDVQPGQYSADVQLITADGKRFTVWPLLKGNARKSVSNWRNLTIMPEVTVE